MSHAYSPGWRRFSIVVLRPLLFGMLKRDWHGQENVPREGGVIIVANHISEADPLALADFVYESGRYPRLSREVHALQTSAFYGRSCADRPDPGLP